MFLQQIAFVSCQDEYFAFLQLLNSSPALQQQLASDPELQQKLAENPELVKQYLAAAGWQQPKIDYNAAWQQSQLQQSANSTLQQTQLEQKMALEQKLIAFHKALQEANGDPSKMNAVLLQYAKMNGDVLTARYQLVSIALCLAAAVLFRI